MSTRNDEERNLLAKEIAAAGDLAMRERAREITQQENFHSSVTADILRRARGLVTDDR